MLAEFLDQLFEHGHVRIGLPQQAVTPDDRAASTNRLVRFNEVRELEFPGIAPEFSVSCAIWSAEQFYRACQAAAFRDLDEATLQQGLAAPCPLADLPSKHYSVDLVFRFLPDLIKLAAGLSPDDPLVKILRQWAGQWPLSSVGMSEVEVISLSGIADVPEMLRYYVDRVIARRDISRLSDPVVQVAVRRALGLYLDQFPDFLAHYRKTEAAPADS